MVVPTELLADVRTLWDYHDLRHEPRRCDVGVGLGSHDLGVATRTAELYHEGWFPRIVFTGANAPTTVERFPRGEAVHFREHALELGVPDAAITVEPAATNTGENIDLTRALLAEQGLLHATITLISRPYQQRRALATAQRRWPEAEFRCAATRQSLADYVESIGDPDRVITMLVGDTQRITRYAELGFAAPQPVPAEVHEAYLRLVEAGYTGRLIPS
ncbi:YdcF family protein [Saccharopolyspora sp. 7B]|uniref:YdcF family protein n=1 Tax=Saccharopolyspora sp. 7B TaxID=2877240 RepID=UPI001CD65F73|nr:YdcF family protein [Saccharopolyspora sp. 7B]MCA1280353.1 YdcF family protein [Saccharopolyspora sp. 7B]